MSTVPLQKDTQENDTLRILSRSLAILNGQIFLKKPVFTTERVRAGQSQMKKMFSVPEAEMLLILEWMSSLALLQGEREVT